MSLVLLGILNSQAAGGGPIGWLGYWGTYGQARYMGLDSSNNLLTAHQSGSSVIHYTSVTPNGAVNWQTDISFGVGGMYPRGIPRTTVGTEYIATNFADNASVNYNNIAMIYASDGTLYDTGTEFRDGLARMKRVNDADSNGEFYVLSNDTATYRKSYLARLNPLTASDSFSVNISDGGSDVDANDWRHGTLDVAIGQNQINSSGWIRAYSGGSVDTAIRNANVNNPRDVYELPDGTYLVAAQYWLGNFSSDFSTINWQKTLAYSTGQDDLTVDSDGNAYLMYSSYPVNTIIKIDTSDGSIIWARTASTGHETAQIEKTTASVDKIYFSSGTVIVAMPADGSGTGTYSYEYGGSSYDFTWSEATATLTTASETFVTDTDLTDTTTTLSYYSPEGSFASGTDTFTTTDF